MSRIRKGSGNLVWIAGATSALAILSCYGTLVVVASLAAAGVAVAVNEGVWAAAIAVLAAAAFIATSLASRRHHVTGPAILAGAGTALVLWALFASYDWRVELAGFLCLALAASWLWRIAAFQTEGE